MRIQIIDIPPIKLEWSKWYSWHDLEDKAKTIGDALPPTSSGVYEVKHVGQEERLTIGKTKNLRTRVIKELVRSPKAHSTGRWIRRENKNTLVVRWAETEREATVEEALHLKHWEKFHTFYKYYHNRWQKNNAKKQKAP